MQEVAPKIYKINEYNLSTMFVIVGSERALCIDCGTGVGDYKAVIERLVEGKPYDMVLSHGHVDHAAAASSSTNIRQQSRQRHCKGGNPFVPQVYIIIMRYLMFSSA